MMEAQGSARGLRREGPQGVEGDQGTKEPHSDALEERVRSLISQLFPVLEELADDPAS